MNSNTQKVDTQSWQTIVSKYNKPKLSRSIWQLINSLGAYLLLWVLMVQTLKISFWLTLPLIIIAAGLLVRVFIIFHDCGHGSFFQSKKLNTIVGKICGIMAFTPYNGWTDNHRIHHQTVGNLDKRGVGDVWTLTVKEYQEMKPGKRFIYGLFRHPIMMLFIGGPIWMVIASRISTKDQTRKQRLNVYLTNVIIAALAVGTSLLIGWKEFLLIQGPVIYLATIAGIYLFYLQHQYDDVIWCRTEEWDYKKMALEGSSFFNLPVILRWFSGNIGYHHIHHLGPTIPNYNLVKCHNENPDLQEVNPISFFNSLNSLKLRLWDEENQKIISFRELRKITG